MEASQDGGTPDGVAGLSPRLRQVVRGLGRSQVAAAWLEVVLLVGSLWALSRVGAVGIRQNLDKPVFQVYLAERFLALPILVGLSFWIGRGLVRLRRSAALGQAILSSLAAFWALHSMAFDWMDLQFAIEGFDEFPQISAIDISYYLIKFCSGFVHAAVAVLAFRAWRRMSAGDAEEFPGRRFRLIGALLALAMAVPLAFGMVGTAHGLAFEIIRYVTLHSIPT